jgi:hypothetical protein
MRRGGKMDRIRLANEEEVAKIREGADFTPASTALAFDNAATGKPDFAVLRLNLELDPVFFATDSDRRKALFIWGIETGLRMQGAAHAYYFNIAADNAAWQKVVETFGAERLSPVPEYRYKRSL